jgi:hypothetical protein
MKKNLTIIFILSFLLSTVSVAQKKEGDDIQLYFSRSFHGTGDLSGVLFTVEYGHFSKSDWKFLAISLQLFIGVLFPFL